MNSVASTRPLGPMVSQSELATYKGTNVSSVLSASFCNRVLRRRVRLGAFFFSSSEPSPSWCSSSLPVMRLYSLVHNFCSRKTFVEHYALIGNDTGGVIGMIHPGSSVLNGATATHM